MFKLTQEQFDFLDVLINGDPASWEVIDDILDSIYVTGYKHGYEDGQIDCRVDQFKKGK